jgi:hypothetical protein
MGKPSFERIDDIVESVVGRENRLFKKSCLYASHVLGFPLKGGTRLSKLAKASTILPPLCQGGKPGVEKSYMK